jgi:polysaccharide pyruvyl transferase CsaB
MEDFGRRLRIGISGSYGGMNMGDEAILEGILGQLRDNLSADIIVFTRNPADTLARHKVERVVAVRQLTRSEVAPEVRGLDLLILGGGGILYDGDAETYLREVFLAHDAKVPVMTWAISAGPLNRRGAREAVRTGLNGAALITVRDREAYRLLEDVGVTREIHLTADPALLLQREDLSVEALLSEGVEFQRPLVGFSVREPGPAAPDIDPEHYYALLANAADYMVERQDADVLFVPMEITDVQHSHAVMAHMQYAERAEIMRRRYSPGQLLDLAGRLDFAVGMRLHFLIFAALRATPFVALPYASKVTGLLTALGIEVPPMGNVGVGQLIGRIDRAWDTRAEIHSKLGERVPALVDRARETLSLLLQVLRQRVGRS